jgi:hypothetical protein
MIEARGDRASPDYVALLRLERPTCKASQRLGGRHGTADGLLVPVRLDTWQLRQAQRPWPNHSIRGC